MILLLIHSFTISSWLSLMDEFRMNAITLDLTLAYRLFLSDGGDQRCSIGAMDVVTLCLDGYLLLASKE